MPHHHAAQCRQKTPKSTAKNHPTISPPTWQLSWWPWLPCQPSDKTWQKKAMWVTTVSFLLGLYPAAFFTMQAHLIDHGRAQIKVLVALLCTYGFQTFCWRQLEWYLGIIQHDMRRNIWQKGLKIWHHHAPFQSSNMPFREHLGSIADYYCNWWPWAHSVRTLVMSLGALCVMHHHAANLCWPMALIILSMLQCTHRHQKPNQQLSQKSQLDVAQGWYLLTLHAKQHSRNKGARQQHLEQHLNLALRSLKALHLAHTKNRSIRSVMSILGLSWIFAQTWYSHHRHLLSLGDMVMCLGLSIQMLELLYGLNEQWLLWHTAWSKAKRAQLQFLNDAST